jgi:lysophospholipase L1-like esterase
MSLHSKASVKFKPLETDVVEPEHTTSLKDDDGEYYDDEYPYNDDDDNDDDVLDRRYAVPLVGSSRHGSADSLTLVDPEYRAIYWPVYLVVSLCLAVLIAAVVLVPPADESNNNQMIQRYCPLVDTDTTSSDGASTNWTAAWDGYVRMVADWPDRCRNDDDDGASDDDHRCTCLNPSQPYAPVPQRVQAWQQAYDRNLQLIANQTEPVDVILTGDGFVEHWWGIDTGMPTSTDWEGNKAVYDSLFAREHGASVNGLALGIAGDQSPNLLYRLQHGEMSMPEHLQPAVWWVAIGSVDYRASGCLIDCVVAGQIRVVQEILQERQKATVVINSLLPVAGEEDDMLVALAINDALQCYATTTERVEFFNATDLFMSVGNDSDDSSTGRTVNTTLLPDGQHPGVDGSRVWGNAIVAKVEEILHGPNL